MRMAWVYLLIAGGCEVLGTTLFRHTENFARLGPTLACVVMWVLSFYLLNRSLAGVPLGTAYAVWTGIGAAGTVLVGIAFYGEATSVMRMLCLVMLIASMVGLKLFAPD